MSFKTIDLCELDLSIRAFNCLMRYGINNVSSILSEFSTKNDFMKMRNCNDKVSNEIIQKLREMGFDNYGRIEPDEVDNYSALPIYISFLNRNLISKLEDAGIKVIADLLYEIVSDMDVIRLNLSESELTQICYELNSFNLHLGIENETLSDIYCSDKMLSSLRSSGFVKVGDILQIGFSELIDRIGAIDAVEIAKHIKTFGYLLVGYPGLENADTCHKLEDYFLEQPLDYLNLNASVIKDLKAACASIPTIRFLTSNDISFLYNIIPCRTTWLEISDKLTKLQLPPLDIDRIPLDNILNFKIYKDMGTNDFKGFLAMAGSSAFPKNKRYTVINKGITFKVDTYWAKCDEKFTLGTYDAYAAIDSMYTRVLRPEEILWETNGEPQYADPKFDKEKLIRLSNEEKQRRISFLGAVANLLNDQATMEAIIDVAVKKKNGTLYKDRVLKLACSGIADFQDCVYALVARAKTDTSLSIVFAEVLCKPGDNDIWASDFISTPHEGLRITDALKKTL